MTRSWATLLVAVGLSLKMPLAAAPSVAKDAVDAAKNAGDGDPANRAGSPGGWVVAQTECTDPACQATAPPNHDDRTAIYGTVAPMDRQSPEFQEIWRKSQSLRPHPSTSEDRVRVSFYGGEYDIPRNYVAVMQSSPGYITELHVMLPNFSPFTETTRPCFEHKIDCQILHFFIVGGVTPPQTVLQRFSDLNLRNNKDIGDYISYSFGPESMRVTSYSGITRENMTESLIVST